MAVRFTYPYCSLIFLISISIFFVGCTGNDHATSQQINALFERSLSRELLRYDDPALKQDAKLLLERLRQGKDIYWSDKINKRSINLPSTIRVWRRSVDGNSDSCASSSIIETLPLEDYVKGVLPHEWIVSWDTESLRAGAIAIRSYASSWVLQGGKYNCADLCDTTRSQVYDDDRNDKASAAVDYTLGLILRHDSTGEIEFAEYSAENGDPTAYGVEEPHCTGKELFGHGRGMCQWGTQRWATISHLDHRWIAEHYYPEASLYSTLTPTGDLNVDIPLENDASTPIDQAITPQDSQTQDFQLNDTKISPDSSSSSSLDGGCRLSASSSKVPLAMVFGLLFLFRSIRRRKG